MDLAGWTAIVAGAGGGIGRATAHALAELGRHEFGSPDILVSNAGVGFSRAPWDTRDVVGSGITVNGVNPASTGTPMVAAALEKLGAMGEAGRRRVESLLARMQKPEQVAVAIASLCLPGEAHINGPIFLVEHNRIGLFQPLTVTREVEREEPWTPDALCEALGRLELHGLADAYS